MGSIVKLSETRCGFRPRPRKWSPEMASPHDLKRLRALYEGDPAEAFQRDQERLQELSARRQVARLF